MIRFKSRLRSPPLSVHSPLTLMPLSRSLQVKSIQCIPLTEYHLPAVLALDQHCFGALWSEAGYRREMTSPNSDLQVILGLSPDPDVDSFDISGAPIDPDPINPDSINPNPIHPDAIHPDQANSTVLDPPLAPSEPQVLGFGCSWAILDEAHITLLAVAPSYQRQGLGKWLLLQLLQGACDRGLQRATLEVRVSNLIALKLYESLGFKIAGQRRRYYTDGEDALILWQSGLQSPGWQTQLQHWQQQSDRHLMAQGWHLHQGPEFPEFPLGTNPIPRD